MSSARSRSMPTDWINDTDELTSQAEKLLQKVINYKKKFNFKLKINFFKARYSPALRCYSLAIDNILLKYKKIEEMEKLIRVKLIKLFIRRAQCYMKMAERFGKTRYAKLANEDCSFLRDNKVFATDLNEKTTTEDKNLGNTLSEVTTKADEYIAIRTPQETKQAVNRNQRRTRNSNRGGRRNQRNGGQNSGHNNHNHKVDADECCQETQVDVNTCSKLVDSNLAINALSNDDQCPICFIQWSNFIDPSIAAILSCSHACCATCLLRFQRECFDGQDIEEDEKLTFSCVLCRKNISRSVIEQVARGVVSKRLIGSFNLLAKKLPFGTQEYEDLIVSLLLDKKIEFDVSKVENALFNMVGLVDDRQFDQKLNHKEKQRFYEIARAPVLKIQEEYSSLRQILTSLNDTDSVEWKEKKGELQESQKKLNEARKNAAADIFERMNSFGNMGAIVEEDERFSRVHIDLHGLHVNEAKEKVNEYVMPILPALKKIIVITGHGAHAQDGESVLKESIKVYFASLNVKCIESVKNKGALCVYYE